MTPDLVAELLRPAHERIHDPGSACADCRCLVELPAKPGADADQPSGTVAYQCPAPGCCSADSLGGNAHGSWGAWRLIPACCLSICIATWGENLKAAELNNNGRLDNISKRNDAGPGPGQRDGRLCAILLLHGASDSHQGGVCRSGCLPAGALVAALPHAQVSMGFSALLVS